LLKKIEDLLHQGITELFATAAVEELAGDMTAYYMKLSTIATIAETLGVSTDISIVIIDLKDNTTNGDDDLNANFKRS